MVKIKFRTLKRPWAPCVVCKKLATNNVIISCNFTGELDAWFCDSCLTEFKRRVAELGVKE